MIDNEDINGGYDEDEDIVVKVSQRTRGDEHATKVRVNLTMGTSKAEVLKRDLMSKDSILAVKIVAPNSNAGKVSIDDSLYSIDSFEVAEEVEVNKSGRVRIKESLNGLRYFTVKSIPIDSIAKERQDDEEFLRINGDILVKRKGSTEPRPIDHIYFTDRETALDIAALATEVELEKAEEMMEEAKKVSKFLKDQLENKRF
jgi:hypothetical protein